MRLLLPVIGLVLAASSLIAQSHTLIVLKPSQSHGVRAGIPNRAASCTSTPHPISPHEATVSPDGKRIFVAVPQGPA